MGVCWKEGSKVHALLGHTQIVQTGLRRITGMLNKLKLYLCSRIIKLKGLLGAWGPRICQICLSSAVQL